MPTYEITKVHLVQPYGRTHPHIEQVELTDRLDQRFPRSVIVADLKNPQGDRYYTHGGGLRADVILDSCPYCGEADYITTTPDSTTANNLLHLPRF